MGGSSPSFDEDGVAPIKLWAAALVSYNVQHDLEADFCERM